MNTPYVKQYNDLGQVINPIQGKYLSNFPNRSLRHQKQKRFKSNANSLPLLFVNYGNGKFERFIKQVQIIGKKKILHYTKC